MKKLEKLLLTFCLSAFLSSCPNSVPTQIPKPTREPIFPTYDFDTSVNVILSEKIYPDKKYFLEVDSDSSIDGTILNVPMGLLPIDFTVSIGEVSNPPELPVANRNYVGTPINLLPEGFNFLQDLTLGIPYTAEQLKDAGSSNEYDLELYSYDTWTDSWGRVNNVYFDYENKFALAEINHFSYYSIICLNDSAPDDLGNPQAGDLVYCLGSIFGPHGKGWRPGHVGVYVGEKSHDGVPYNVIEAIANGVTRSYFSPLSEFGRGAIYMGAREPKDFILTSQQRTDIVSFAEAQVGKPYAWAQTAGVFFGMLRGSLVKGPDSFNCVGLAEKAYEDAGVNSGIGLVNFFSEELNGESLPIAALTPAEQYMMTKPAGIAVAPTRTKTATTTRTQTRTRTPKLETIVLQPDSSEMNDAYVTLNTYPDESHTSKGCGDCDFLNVETYCFGSNSCTKYESFIQFPVDLPSNSKIKSATLSLYGQGDFILRTSTVDTVMINSPWSESFVTWDTKPSFAETLSVTNLSKEKQWWDFDITSAVQQWVDGTPNYGVALRTDYHRPVDPGFFSSDYPDSSLRPKITITYTK